MAIKEWSELSSTQRKAVIAIAAVETVLTAVALVDLSKRSSAQVRGPKALWAALCFVQPVGPPAYFVLGRK